MKYKVHPETARRFGHFFAVKAKAAKLLTLAPELHDRAKLRFKEHPSPRNRQLVHCWDEIKNTSEPTLERLFNDGTGTKEEVAGAATLAISDAISDFDLPGPVTEEAWGRLRDSYRILGNWQAEGAFFEGRSDVLRDLDGLHQKRKGQGWSNIYALCGMPGMGKTSVAQHYVLQNGHQYTLVVWLSAEDVTEVRSTLGRLGPLLEPPVLSIGRDEVDHPAVKQWFESNPGWLIVADNAEDAVGVLGVLPQSPHGRILLTTRKEDPGGGAFPLPVKRMKYETGAIFLLRRAGRLREEETLDVIPTDWLAGAKAVSVRLGGLPLALEQAGAYLASTKNQTPFDYLAIFEHRLSEALSYDGGMAHPTVYATFTELLEKIRQKKDYGPAVEQFVRMCAFLAPESIPEAVFLSYLDKWEGPLHPFAEDGWGWNSVVRVVTDHSLLRCDADRHMFSLHRLVGDVVRHTMNEEERHETMRLVVSIMSYAFPPFPDYRNWPACNQYLPHAKILREHMNDYGFKSEEGADLLGYMAIYLRQRGLYSEAEPLYIESLRMYETVFGCDHPRVAEALGNMGVMLINVGRYDEAINALKSAIEMDDRLGDRTDDLDHAARFDCLGWAYYGKGLYEKSEEWRTKALDITIEKLGKDHGRVSIRLKNLSWPVEAQGKFTEAVSLRRRSLQISRKAFGVDHLEHANALYGVGAMYVRADKPRKAERYLRKSLDLYEKVHEGREHPSRADVRLWLAKCLLKQANTDEAHSFAIQAHHIYERTLPKEHSSVAEAKALIAAIEASTWPT